MCNKLFTTFVFVITLAFAFQNISAQITITIPKIKVPKIKKDKPKPEETPTGDSNQTTNDGNQTTINTPNEPKTDEQTQPVKEDECKEQGVMYAFLEDARKQLEDVESFTPGRGWFVRSMNYSPIYYAVSPKARQERYKDSALIKCQNLLAAYDKLGAAAAKKLPQFLPDKAEYPATTPVNANLIKGRITGLADYKIFYIGVKEANWLIDKNDYGLPTARFKHGLAWVRYTPDDHPYCRIYYINLVQDYAGGGTYGATYGNFVGETLAGCPAGK